MQDFSKQLTAELDSLWRFAMRLTGNPSDAEDLVQRTCTKALENAHQYQPQNKLRSWLFRIEHRIWLNVLRKRRVRQHYSEQSAVVIQEAGKALTDPGPEPISQLETPESALELQQVFAAVEALNEPHRVVVILVCVEGLTYEEAARVLDVPKGTIMSRLSRARKQLVATRPVSHHFVRSQTKPVELSVVLPAAHEKQDRTDVKDVMKTEQAGT